jgi:hypothetical protein
VAAIVDEHAAVLVEHAIQAPLFKENPVKHVVAVEVDEHALAPFGHLLHSPELK